MPIALRGMWKRRAPSNVLDIFSGGTFARPTEGSYLTAAPTNGSTAFLVWALAHARRIEDRGDGLGPMLKMEGSRTNHVLHSRDVSSAPWTAAGVVTLNDGASPDGAVLADRIECAAAGFGPYVSPISGLTAGAAYVASAWMRRRGGAGSGPYQYAFFDDTGGVGASAVGTLSEIWARIEAKEPALGSTTLNTYVPVDGRLNGGFSFSNRALDNVVDLHQIENGFWPSSPIRTAGVSATRAADALSYTSGDYPASFLTTGCVVAVALDCTSAELIAAAADMRVLQVGASDYLRIRASAGACVVDLVCGGVVVATRTITMAARGVLLTLSAAPSTGSLTVAGATTGNGTTVGVGAPWASGALYVGTDNVGGNPLFGRVGQHVGTP